jgi:hypothetical protein
LEKIARYEKLENFSSVFQNGLAFLGRIGKASLSEFPEINSQIVDGLKKWKWRTMRYVKMMLSKLVVLSKG